MRATSQNGARIFYAILAASMLLASGVVCVVAGCGDLHIHLGTRHYCGPAASQPTAMIGSSNPTVVLEAE
jgi:hypothetical protein